MRRYTGPFQSSRHSTILPTSTASAGQRTVIPGRARMIATSSRAWWVLPSPKSDSPQLEPQIRTFRFGMQTAFRN